MNGRQQAITGVEFSSKAASHRATHPSYRQLRVKDLP